MDINEEYKDKLGQSLTLQLAQALKAGNITEEDLPTAASYILNRIDTLKTKEELIQFLTDLASKWTFFSNTLLMEKGEIIEAQEDKKVDQMEELIKQNKLDEALSVAHAE